MNGPLSEHPGLGRTRPVAPFAVIAELSVLYEIASLGMAESEEQLGHEAAEKVSRLFGARYFALLKGPMLHQRPIVMWGINGAEELKTLLMRSRPNQFRFAFSLGHDESVTVFAEQARPIDDREKRLYTILARRVQALMVMFKSIREIERALDANRKQNARILAVVRSTNEGLIATDTAGRIELMNPPAELFTGWSAEEARGRSAVEVLRIVQENDRASRENMVEQILRDGLPTGSAADVLLIGRDNVERVAEVLCSPIKDESGDLAGWIWILRDQAKERAMRRKVEETLARLQQGLDVAGVIILALDREGRITLINRKGREVLGVPEGENLVGQDWFGEFLPEDQRADARTVFDALMEGKVGVAEHHENAVVCRDGTSRIIEWFNSVLRDDAGRPIGAFSSGTDVTDLRASQKKTEQQLVELRRWYEVTLGREEVVLRLKAEVNELCQKLGLPPRYEITR